MSDIVERLRDGSPSQCWSCGEWGCTNAAGHDVFCMGDCECEVDCECVCSKCGGDPVCACECHEWYTKVLDAADEIEKLREAGDVLTEALQDTERRHPCNCADWYDGRTRAAAIAEWEQIRQNSFNQGRD